MPYRSSSRRFLSASTIRNASCMGFRVSDLYLFDSDLHDVALQERKLPILKRNTTGLSLQQPLPVFVNDRGYDYDAQGEQ